MCVSCAYVHSHACVTNVLYRITVCNDRLAMQTQYLLTCSARADGSKVINGGVINIVSACLYAAYRSRWKRLFVRNEHFPQLSLEVARIPSPSGFLLTALAAESVGYASQTNPRVPARTYIIVAAPLVAFFLPPLLQDSSKRIANKP